MKAYPKNKLKVKNTLARQFGDGGLEPGGENYKVAMDLFFRHEKLREIRPKTLGWYELILNCFEKYLIDKELTTAPIFITRETVEDYLLHVREHGNKPVSVNGKIRALRVFFNFLENENIIAENPMQNIKLLRDVQHVVSTFSEEQIKDLLKQPDRSTLTGARDYMIMLMLLDTGARISELLSLKRQDISWQNKLPVAITLQQWQIQ